MKSHLHTHSPSETNLNSSLGSSTWTQVYEIPLFLQCLSFLSWCNDVIFLSYHNSNVLNNTASHQEPLVLLLVHTHTPVISLDLNGQNCRTLNLANWPWLWSKRVQPSGVHTAERFCSVPSPTEEEEVSAGSSYSLCAKLLSSPSVVGNLQHHRTISSTTLRADWSISSWTNERQRRARACCSASSLTISSPYR